MKPVRLNVFGNKGQAFASMELVIASIMALALLLIIVGLIAYFNQITESASQRAFKDAVVSAVNSPNGAVVKTSDDLILSKGIIAPQLIADYGNIPRDCVSIKSSPVNSAFAMRDNGTVEIVNTVKTVVFLRCVLGSDYGAGTNCAESCLVSIGEPITVSS